MAGFVWDTLCRHLLRAYGASWGLPYSDMTARTEVAVIFSKRVEHRTQALDLLFRAGLYDQSIPLVRGAYEDWLQSGHILHLTATDDESRALKYREDVAKTEAQLYKSFGALAGVKARKAEMPHPPPEIVELSSKTNRQLRVSGNWAGKADDLGLRAVHDCVHPYLSELSHGNMRNYAYLFVNDEEADEMAPVPLERDADTELVPALWSFWFQFRTLAICAHERDLDLEPQLTGFLRELKAQGKHASLATACFQKEK